MADENHNILDGLHADQAQEIMKAIKKMKLDNSKRQQLFKALSEIKRPEDIKLFLQKLSKYVEKIEIDKMVTSIKDLLTGHFNDIDNKAFLLTLNQKNLTMGSTVTSFCEELNGVRHFKLLKELEAVQGHNRFTDESAYNTMTIGELINELIKEETIKDRPRFTKTIALLNRLFENMILKKPQNRPY